MVVPEKPGCPGIRSAIGMIQSVTLPVKPWVMTVTPAPRTVAKDIASAMAKNALKYGRRLRLEGRALTRVLFTMQTGRRSMRRVFSQGQRMRLATRHFWRAYFRYCNRRRFGVMHDHPFA